MHILDQLFKNEICNSCFCRRATRNISGQDRFCEIRALRQTFRQKFQNIRRRRGNAFS